MIYDSTLYVYAMHIALCKCRVLQVITLPKSYENFYKQDL